MSGNVNICEVTDDVKKALKEFRFRKAQDTAALILKVDREKQQRRANREEPSTESRGRNRTPGHVVLGRVRHPESCSHCYLTNWCGAFTRLEFKPIFNCLINKRGPFVVSLYESGTP
jgi:hypothetical protein